MKRLPLLFGLLMLAGVARAGKTVYQGPLVNETGLAYSNTYTLDVNSYGIDTLSMQAFYSSASISSQNFTDGTASTGTITVSSSSLSTLSGVKGSDTVNVVTNSALGLKQATDTLRVSSNSIGALGGATITINGNIVQTPRDWFVLDVASNTALSIRDAINTKIGDVSATASGSTVTITADVFGTAGNAYTLVASTAAALVRGAATFSGGQNAATVNLNGNLLTANVDWTVADVSSNTAVNLATALNAITGFSASTTTASTTTVSCTTIGTFCNSDTLTSSTPTALTVGGATFSGGQDPAYVMINGVKLVANTDFTPVLTASGTARAISDAILANTSLAAIINSTWSLVAVSSKGVVYATSTANASTTGYSMIAKPAAVLTVGAAQMVGGTDSGVVTSASEISIANNNFTMGLPVLYTKSAGSNPGTLTANTTYYAVPVTSTLFKLSTTSAGAVAGTGLVAITTQTAGGGGSFTLAPLAFTGSASFKWQSSNDGSTFVDLPNVSSVTFSSPYTAATSMWDGPIYFRYLKLNVVGPTTGGLVLKVTGNGKITSVYGQ